MANAADWLDNQIRKLLAEAAVDCLGAVIDGMISVECRHTNVNSYMQI